MDYLDSEEEGTTDAICSGNSILDVDDSKMLD
jgi:hypothetical protein